jgi:hypothetical protein
MASEPLLAVYESETSEDPSVFGCGSPECSPIASGHPTMLRVERFSAIGTVVGETDFELPASLQQAYAGGAVSPRSKRSPICLPWVRITRDPARFSACLKASRELGRIDSAQKVFDLLKKQGMTEDQEVFYVILLDTQSFCRGIGEISRGARDRTQAPVPDVLRLPLVDGAMAFIIAHNHPSGIVTPSEADKEVTKSINEASKTIGVPLMDHVIIGTDSFYSFYDKNQLK